MNPGEHPNARVGTRAVVAHRRAAAAAAGRRRAQQERQRAAKALLVGDGDLTAEQLREKFAAGRAAFYQRQAARAAGRSA